MYEELLRRVGLKITAPRLNVLSVLHDPKKRHWTAESMRQALHDHGCEVPLATVYRVLTQFELCGLTQRHFFENEVSVFELAEIQHHDHLVCLECGNVAEFVDEVIEQHQRNIAKRFKFTMQDHRLVIYGACAACSSINERFPV